MKKRVLSVIVFAALVVAIFSGCAVRALPARVEKLEDSVEHRLDRVENRVENALENVLTDPSRQSPPAEQELSAADAEQIALEHAGFTADGVQYLHTEYEIDDGVPEYQVKFRHDRWEYDYEIHAETGKILSFEKDD